MVIGKVDMNKLFIFLFLIFIRVNALEISLELEGAHNIRDEQTGKVVQVVSHGEHFKIIAVVHGGGRNSSDIKIKNLDKLESYGLSEKNFSFSNFNNSISSNINHTYSFIADKEGEFEIGPAVINHGGKNFESNKLFFKVIKKEVFSHIDNHGVRDDKKYELFCKLEVDKSIVVEGEPIELSLKIYRRGKILQVGIHPVEFSGFEVKEVEEPISGQEDIQGRVYSVLEKKYILFPLEPGLKKIEPMHVDFNVPVNRNIRGFGGFHDFNIFLGPMAKTKRAVSNGLQVNVKSLPNYYKNVDGIGVFSKLDISADKYDAILNEPILLTLEVSGIGNLDQIVAPKLNLPELFTYYQSKTKVEREERVSSLAGKKIFEYIVQVGKLGKHQVGFQEFVYFDTEAKTYKVLKSNNITFNIKNPPEQQRLSYDDNYDSKNNKKLIEKDYESDINFIEECSNFLSEHSRTELPLIWFFILLCFPFVIYFKGFLKKLFSIFFIKKIPVKLENDLDLIISEKKDVNLYKFFIRYFSLRFNLEQDEINEDWIENKLLALDWDTDKVNDFLSYLHLCASLSFASVSDDYLDRDKLLKKSKYWFFMLESKK